MLLVSVAPILQHVNNVGQAETITVMVAAGLTSQYYLCTRYESKLGQRQIFLLLEWDVYSQIFVIPIVLGAPLAQAFAFKGIGKLMNEFASIYGKHERLHIGNGRKMYNKAWWRVLTLPIIQLPTSICVFVTYTFFMFMNILPPTQAYIGGFLIAISGYITIIPATTLGKCFAVNTG